MATTRRKLTVTKEPKCIVEDNTAIITDGATKTAQGIGKIIGNLTFDALDKWMQDNQYIVSGYRPATNSFRTSFSSIFAIHNETVNIWTHLLPAVVLPVLLSVYAVKSPREAHNMLSKHYPSATSVDALVIGIFILGSGVMFSASWTYHAVSNHSHAISKYWNKLDYVGIICMIISSFVPSVYYGHYCNTDKITFYLFLLSSLGLVAFCFTILDRFRTSAWRPYRAGMFVLLGLSAVVPVTEALLTHGLVRVENEMSLWYCITEAILYITGALIYAYRSPERNYPGKFDIIGSSHQIFHCCVVLASIAHALGVRKAFLYRHVVLNGQCKLGQQ